MKNRLKQKGVLFVEYALALAFVIVVGVVFISSDGQANSINEIFAKASAMLNGATEDKPVAILMQGETQKALY